MGSHSKILIRYLSDKLMTSVSPSKQASHPCNNPTVMFKFPEKLLEVPVVFNTVSALSHLTYPLSPYLEISKTFLGSCYSNIHYIIRGYILPNLPDMVQDKIDSVTDALVLGDSTACSVLEQMEERLPLVSMSIYEKYSTGRDSLMGWWETILGFLNVHKGKTEEMETVTNTGPEMENNGDKSRLATIHDVEKVDRNSDSLNIETLRCGPVSPCRILSTLEEEIDPSHREESGPSPPASPCVSHSKVDQASILGEAMTKMEGLVGMDLAELAEDGKETVYPYIEGTNKFWSGFKNMMTTKKM